MNSDEAFARFSRAIESDPWDILLAKWRRDRFVAALQKLPGVLAVIESGSLARGTTIGEINDIDLIVLMDRETLPGRAEGSGSADEALAGLQDDLDGTEVVGQSRIRNHVVKCEAGVPDIYQLAFGDPLRPALPVDVMPAFRSGWNLLCLNPTALRVPERRNDRWVTVNPEQLIELVEERQREWRYFKPCVQMLKAWNKHVGLELPTAVLEVLVLRYMPRPRYFQTLSYAAALAGFFEAANKADIGILTGMFSPVSFQLDLEKYDKLRRELGVAAGLANQAIFAEAAGADPSDYWRELFGAENYPGRDIFSWVFSAPPHPRHTLEPTTSWFGWLLQLFELGPTPDRDKWEGGTPDGRVDLTPPDLGWLVFTTSPDRSGPKRPQPPTRADVPSAGPSTQRSDRADASAQRADPDGRLDGVFDEHEVPVTPQTFGRG